MLAPAATTMVDAVTSAWPSTAMNEPVHVPHHASMECATNQVCGDSP